MSSSLSGRLCMVLALVLMSLGGCEAARTPVGFNARSAAQPPATDRPRLTVPPEIGIRPPPPGLSRTPDAVPRRDAAGGRRTGRAVANPIDAAYRSTGEIALLRAAGAEHSVTDIRVLIDRETSVLAGETREFTDRLMFLETPDAPPEPVIRLDGKPYQPPARTDEDDEDDEDDVDDPVVAALLRHAGETRPPPTIRRVGRSRILGVF